jgi:hypothetical protein
VTSFNWTSDYDTVFRGAEGIIIIIIIIIIPFVRLQVLTAASMKMLSFGMLRRVVW